MTEQEGLPGDATLQMIALQMNIAPLPSTYLHIDINSCQLRNELDSVLQFDLWIRDKEKVVQTVVLHLFWLQPAVDNQYCPVHLSLFG